MRTEIFSRFFHLPGYQVLKKLKTLLKFYADFGNEKMEKKISWEIEDKKL